MTNDNSVFLLLIIWGLFVHSRVVICSGALQGFMVDVCIFQQFWKCVSLFPVDTLCPINIPFRKGVQYVLILILCVEMVFK
jgi:cell shape-determining protein MreD